MQQAFAQKVVFVTGAASGIGRASALAFARQGARVAVVDMTVVDGEETVRLIRDAGGEAIFFRVDVTRAAEVEQFIADIVSQWGRIDIAHNNAGISSAQVPTAEIREEDFDRVLAVNLKGVWLCMKYAINQMLKQGGGAIVNTASALSLTVLPNSAPYNASKHAVAALTKTAAIEYAKHNIRINAVCPGVIRTPLLENTPGVEHIRDALIALHPIGRLGEVDEVAKAVLWLASDDASFSTGSLLSVDGGWVAS